MPEMYEYATLIRGTAILPDTAEFDHLPFDILARESTPDDVVISSSGNVKASLDKVRADGWQVVGDPEEIAGMPGASLGIDVLATLRNLRPEITGLAPVYARFRLARPRMAP